MEGVAPRIAAAVVTYRRHAELRRLLDCLSRSTLPLAGCIVSDHAAEGIAERLASDYAMPIHSLEDPSNPGPGAGWANAASHAFLRFGADLDAIWFLDDDVAPPANALEVLYSEMRRAGALAIAPLLEDSAGELWGFPEPCAKPLRRKIRRARSPADARLRLGDQPIPCCWCTGASFLVSRQAIQQAGTHRSDFWMLGEDLEYSMRISSLGPAVFTCRVSVPHLPPLPASAEQARRGDYYKFCSLLQNLSYLSFHSPHSRHMKRYLPGNFRRFLRTHGFRARTLRDAAACLWGGAILSQPSGARSGECLRARIRSYEPGT